MGETAQAPVVVWSPQSGPQSALLSCPVYEVFFGGARGGGKTDGVLGDWAAHANQYARNAIGLMVRRTRIELTETFERAKVLYEPLGAVLTGGQNQPMRCVMPNGARLRFDYLEKDSDADGYQGHSYTRVYVEEAGNFPLGKALYTIGRTDLLGLNPSLNSFEVSTLETPLGGNFAVQEEQEIQFKSARATRTSVFDQASRYEQRRAAQRSQIRGYQSSDALLGRLGSF